MVALLGLVFRTFLNTNEYLKEFKRVILSLSLASYKIIFKLKENKIDLKGTRVAKGGGD